MGRPTYSSRLNVVTREKSICSALCSRTSSWYRPSGVDPVAMPSTALGLVLSTSTTICRSEEHTSELQSQSNLVCRLLLEKKKKSVRNNTTQPLRDHDA